MKSIMRRISLLPDEQLKRENIETINNINSIMASLSTHLTAKGLSQCNDVFHMYWFENIMKFMSSSSLVLKLCAWEQLSEIIQESKISRPLASSYIVIGAGTDMVNGTYVVSNAASATTINNQGGIDPLQYTKPGTKSDMPLLTLFRCQMRTKAKWWFISQADGEKPGTEKDIDFYVHKSTLEEEREPSCRNWTRVNSGNKY